MQSGKCIFKSPFSNCIQRYGFIFALCSKSEKCMPPFCLQIFIHIGCAKSDVHFSFALNIYSKVWLQLRTLGLKNKYDCALACPMAVSGCSARACFHPLRSELLRIETLHLGARFYIRGAFEGRTPCFRRANELRL